MPLLNITPGTKPDPNAQKQPLISPKITNAFSGSSFLRNLGAPQTPPAGYSNPSDFGVGVQQGPPKPVGVKAISPANNVSPASNTISPKFQAPGTGNNSSYTKDAQNNVYDSNGNHINLDQFKAANLNIDQIPSRQAPVVSTQNAPASQVNGTSVTAQPQISTPPQEPQSVNYGGILQQLFNRAQSDSPEVQRARQALLDSQMSQAQQLAGNSSNPIPLEFQQGRAQVLNTQYGQQQQALSGALNSATTTQGQELSALQGAAGLAAPQLAGFNQQAFNPLTSQFSGGGDLNGAVQTVAQKVQSGQMTYQDALGALSGYGQGGQNALLQALGPNFNVAQSNTLASQQGSVGPAYSFAKSALSNLQNIVQQLGFAQGSNVPGINSIGNWLSTTFGVNSDKTRQYTGAVQEARNAYAQLLAASRGGTPTDYGNQASAAIPDNATPNDIQAAINNLESLGGSKLNIYGNPGASTTNSGGSSGSGLFNW